MDDVKDVGMMFCNKARSLARAPGTSLKRTPRRTSLPVWARPFSMIRSRRWTSMFPPLMTRTTFFDGLCSFRQKGCQRRGARAFSHHTFPLHQHENGRGDLLLVDGDDLIDVSLEDGEGDLPDPPERDSVRQGGSDLDLHNLLLLQGDEARRGVTD